ncbi:RNA-binding domain-containing protein [Macrolepiota fuliginosa MF-IS2]|uniref:RNA-binding domain-containing protein n=1 Tax=Macrolepiota fuliginosa MF-IS2 TaxID=1400762 RepID=A0A9P6BZH5_9AGAR|nr:RNA-binding domain-containing protein [Macrolepiota fuliginosa MF-IS2]
MAEPSPPPIQQPQPGLPSLGFVAGQTPVIPGQQPVVPGQQPFVPPATEQALSGEENVCETLYIQNLNEKVKPQVMKATLRGLFKSYGEVLDVVAHSNLRMRGQAFVSFTSVDSAKKALKDVQRFPLYSKPMQISFAKTRSDAVVKKLDSERFDEHKKHREDNKKETRYTNPIKSKFRLKRMAAEVDGGAALPQSKRPAVQMPDEYLPPNKILFLQNLPESVTKDQLMSLFSQYPNLYEVRMIPTKKDIAFVEYMDEGSATVAKDALHNYKLDGENKIKITFARK